MPGAALVDSELRDRERHGRRVQSLTVRLADVNGPRGGVEKQCQVSVRLTYARRVIVVGDLDANEATVISRAAELSRAIARAVRWRDLQRAY